MKIPGFIKDFHLRKGGTAQGTPDANPEQASVSVTEDETISVSAPTSTVSETSATSDVKSSGQETPVTSREPDDIESLWFSLLDDPNNEKNLNRLIKFCQTRKGPASVNAALAELSLEEGSFLPKLILASMALERKEPEEAVRHYKELLAHGSAGDYSLLRMSADMGRNGYPSEMISIVGPLYEPEKNNEYIGLNLLQAYKETGDIHSGKYLYDRLKSLGRAKIAPGLQSFERVFAAGDPGKARKENLVRTTGTGNGRPDDSPAAAEISASSKQTEDTGVQAASITDSNVKISHDAPEPSGNPARAKMMQVPIWKSRIPALSDLLPKAESGPRIGIYLYSDTTTASEAESGGQSISAAQLATAVPMSVAEQFLFTSPVVPIVLFPVSFEKGPDMGSAEPDVQSLFSLCTKESLDFLITGTVCRTREGYQIRSWLIDKTKKTARIISRDIPAGDFGLAMSGHVEEMVSLFRDKNYAFEVKRLGFTYSFPSGSLYETHLVALERLARRSLVDEGICSADILCEPEAFLGTLASLYAAKPLCQNYLMMLLSGMLSDKDRGGETYRKYRDLLYDGARKMQYIPCVTSSRKELDRVLRT